MAAYAPFAVQLAYQFAGLDQIEIVHKCLISLGFNEHSSESISDDTTDLPEHPGRNTGDLTSDTDHHSAILKLLAECGVSEELRRRVGDELTIRAALPSAFTPFPQLTVGQLAAIEKRAAKRSWTDRRNFGYAWKSDVFEFVSKEYKKWIPGLTQADLSADPDLYAKFTREVSSRGLPEWLDVPTEYDANLRRITDPVERTRLIAFRALVREKKHQLRQRSLKT